MLIQIVVLLMFMSSFRDIDSLPMKDWSGIISPISNQHLVGNYCISALKAQHKVSRKESRENNKSVPEPQISLSSLLFLLWFIQIILALLKRANLAESMLICLAKSFRFSSASWDVSLPVIVAEWKTASLAKYKGTYRAFWVLCK